jgi:hypothetical protein
VRVAYPENLIAMNQAHPIPDQNRRRGQAERILAILRAAGGRGVTNAELWPIAHAAHSRISDLRARGHRIRCEREGSGLYRYTLEPPDAVPPLLSLIGRGVTLPLFASLGACE